MKSILTLVRAIGPTLGEFGVAGVVADPKFEFFGPGNLKVGTNDKGSASVAAQAAVTAAVQYTGAFPVPVNSRDAGSVSVIGSRGHTVVIS
jgi:hypothetical protein